MLEEINKLLGRKEIHVYRTHIEIFPYKKNENYNIQKLFSKYNFVCRKYEPIAYTVFNNKLYIPRIADIGLLENMFKTRAVIETEWDLSENISKKKYAMTCSPRSKTQEDAIAFLTSDGRFHYTMKNAQYGLNLDTGKGKTYCTINAILQSGLKAIIVLPRTSIKEQWVKTFDEMTNVPLSRVKSIDSSEEIKAIMKNPKYDFYMINHQLLITFGNKYGWDSVTEFFKKMS